jgi:hypothetical protein
MPKLAIPCETYYSLQTIEKILSPFLNKYSKTEGHEWSDDLGNLPGLVLEFYSVFELKIFVEFIYEKEFLKEETLIFDDVPDDILDILNGNTDIIDNEGFKCTRNGLKLLQLNREDLL